MDEEITIIDTNTRNEKIRNFFINNKNKLIIILLTITILIVGFLTFVEIKKINKIKLADHFNSVTLNFQIDKKENTTKDLINLVKEEDTTYSPLALYFLIDNKLIKNENDINDLFDVLINKTDLEKEIKNLIIYKKAIYNADLVDENVLIQIVNPLINSESIWKSHALYLIAEYFYSKGENKKAKEFYNQILILSNSNKDIVFASRKRLNRDLSE